LYIDFVSYYFAERIQTIINVGKDAGKKEPLYTVGMNVN
jgi:hypothetical protein